MNSVSGVFEAEPDLDANLEVIDLAIADVPADFGDLEPVEVPQRLGGALNAVSDGSVDAFIRCPDDLGDAVRAVRHSDSFCIGLPSRRAGFVTIGRQCALAESGSAPYCGIAARIGRQRAMNRREKPEVFSVTSAPESPAAERDERARRYIIAMSIRIACFCGVWLVHGWLRLVMVILMVILPYVAVVIANAGREQIRKIPRPVPPEQRTAIEGHPDVFGPAGTPGTP